MESQATTERLKAAKVRCFRADAGPGAGAFTPPPQAFAPAAQCVAKLLISTDPRQLPHSAVLDAVPVLVRLCGVEDPLLQFEGLMAATNVASTGDEALDRLIAAKVRVVLGREGMCAVSLTPCRTFPPTAGRPHIRALPVLVAPGGEAGGDGGAVQPCAAPRRR